jgi:hypothetical protein
MSDETIDDFWAAHARDDFAIHGRPGVYSPPGAGPPVDCTVIVDQNYELPPDQTRALVSQRVTMVALLKSEIPDPKRDATVTVAAETYILNERLPGSDGFETRFSTK